QSHFLPHRKCPILGHKRDSHTPETPGNPGSDGKGRASAARAFSRISSSLYLSSIGIFPLIWSSAPTREAPAPAGLYLRRTCAEQRCRSVPAWCQHFGTIAAMFRFAVAIGSRSPLAPPAISRG